MKKGFTLIELLAVIVILAIIALIATPIVLNIINDTKESATLRSADFYLDALELSIAQSVLENKNITDGTYNVLENGNVCLKYEDTTCTDELEVEVNGETPTIGNIEIKEGNIGYVELTIGGNLVTKTASGELVNGYQTICKAVTTATTGNLPEGNYNPGDEYMCEVKPGTTYRFFALGEDANDSSKVNLIMYANINDAGIPIDSDSVTGIWETPLITRKDYVDNGGSGEAWDANTEVLESGEIIYHGFTDKGPKTAMNFLNKATSTWINIPNLDETYDDAMGGYTNLKITEKARMPKLSEITRAGCSDDQNGGSCPNWIVDYMDISDFLYPERHVISGAGAYSLLDGNGYVIVINHGFYVQSGPIGDGEFGIRPVITVFKNNIK